MKAPLYIVFLWHMHQPDYRDPLKGEYALPWTYLHAVKDYYDMAAIVEAVPGARAVFNFVPSLLEQLEEYADGRAGDVFLRLGMKNPGDMEEEERLFLIGNFFSANRQRMIEPHRRYLELLNRSGGNGGASKDPLRNFSEQDLLDLQVCFFLAWTGEAARRRNPVFRRLLDKGERYTEEDKAILFQEQRKLLQEILPLYRRLHREKKVELSVSPYFHPILPLLCDIKSSLTAMPRANLPAARFRHPEDARAQVKGGIDCFTRFFAAPPAGMWPSEGSVSDEALEILAQSGLRWAATDEDILAKSLPGGLGVHKERLYHPYGFHRGDDRVALFFRDHQLSDLIGFTYSQWEAERAVADFAAKIAGIRDRIGSGVVSIILDGENAWEYYSGNGYRFLTMLYAALVDMPGVRLATFSEVLEDLPTELQLSHVHPGSWINADYGIWVGHPEENLGWDYLERARESAINASDEVADLLAGRRQPQAVSEAAREAVKAIYAAEGSDWFWWYGDDHFSPHSDRFDLLFRRHLMNVYRRLKLEIPRELYEPIKRKLPAGLVREPAALISPVVNGQVDDYFEWLSAGLFDLTRQSSAMHAAENVMQSFFYGFDHTNLYFRLDGSKGLDTLLLDGDVLILHLLVDLEFQLTMDIGTEKGILFCKGKDGWGETGIICRWKVGRVLEAQIPIEAIGPVPGGTIRAFVVLRRNGDEIGRWPADAPLLLAYKGPELELENWLI